MGGLESGWAWAAAMGVVVVALAESRVKTGAGESGALRRVWIVAVRSLYGRNHQKSTRRQLDLRER